MRHPTIDDDELLNRLTAVFQQHGYEGASLRRISEATGLKRASLYHRFPDGKANMAQAVMGNVRNWFRENIFEPLSGSEKPAERVRSMAQKLDQFYAKGHTSCLLDTMSLGADDSPFKSLVHQSFNAWINALKALSIDAGLTADEAQRRAEQAVIRIQGSLVLSRATANARPFGETLEALPELLTKK